ncbi:hypothetical protein [Corynebacterium frankenforstense]|uniref:hypothetical protein n=1 Tax=Corynebacterium frankenforstense TaxID=1230998 RepID=UPI0026ECF377|nr:hypothetical protein [Corynebacterium frankenforstense]
MRNTQRTASSAAALLLAVGVAVSAQPVASALPLGATPPRTQASVQVQNGPRLATPNADEPRPALSLSKLYLGHWVLHHGAPGDAARVEQMIRFSDDRIAGELDARYPQAIDETAGWFGLPNTHRNGFWGNSVTSANDLTRFLDATRNDPVAAPMFRGMETAAPVAADGYRQDYGTATVPGVTGTKFGWSDDRRSVHATASIAPGVVLAANTYGTREAHTADVHAALPAGLPQLPGAPSGQLSIDLGSSAIPAVSGAELKARLACHDPYNLRAGIDDAWLIPVQIADAIPAC